MAFVLMTVVRAVPPTSAKPGDKAILTERGEWLGWVGGSCAEPSARRAAKQAFLDGQSRLLHLTNDETHLARPGVELAAMSCYSGGSLEIYVEPHLPQPALLVFGRSPAAEALCRLGQAMGYGVTHIDLRPGAEAAPSSIRRLVDLGEPARASTYVVVASHGHFEVEALEWALRREVAYVGLVSSRRRWPDVLGRLTQLGLGAPAARVHAPAGLELGAARPEEVALSVLSQIVAERRGGKLLQVAGAEAAAPVPVSVAAPAAGESAVSCCSVAASETEAEAESCCSASPAGGEAVKEPRFAALVLAAGLSRRMGALYPPEQCPPGQTAAPNKLLLSFAGEPLVVRSVRTVLHTGFDQIVVVLGHQAEEVGRALEPLGVRTVLNPDFETGQVSSVRAGLAALLPPLDAVMICLADQPLLEVSDLGALKRAFRERPHGSIVVPTHEGSRGNPVVIDWASAQETLLRGTNYGCRHFLDEHPEQVYRWPAPSDHFLRDIDVPGDVQPLIDRARA